tara:strand:- start:733 stop:1377 length:645 start_codon:yes stop_codon:yes gene_type:complete
MSGLDRLNQLIQNGTVRKNETTYRKTGVEHDPAFACTINIDVISSKETIVVEGKLCNNKKLAYADAVSNFFNDQRNPLVAFSGVPHYDLEIIIDLDNSADLLLSVDQLSNNVNAFASKQYSGSKPKYGTLALAKSLVHDATDLLIAYKAESIVTSSEKMRIVLISKDSAFDSLYRELLEDFSSKSIYFVSNRKELDDLLKFFKSEGNRTLKDDS